MARKQESVEIVVKRGWDLMVRSDDLDEGDADAN